ncbi:SH3 domain-containing protein [Acetivibrio cellulolyticus]|uniref:hypothetical protein n=1 Tax=Acetivibrio cellulolyticus TaxID=35830 RepID=UPI0001E2F0F3|nr:hypothetical protein [Acetivibrio cellulolyticus]
MKIRKIVVSLILACSVIISLSMFVENRQLKRKNTILMENNQIANLSSVEGVEIKTVKGEEPEVENAEVCDGVLKDGFRIDLYENYDGFPSVPAYGPLCKLNAFGINQTKAAKIIGKKDEFFTRISIEGVVPTWVIEGENNSNIGYIENEIMYVLSECDVFITPEEDSKSVFKAYKGNSVTVTAEYKDWYFITMNYYMDSNSFSYGWIKKSDLGYYKEFDSNIELEVNVKKGSPIKIDGNDGVEIVKDSLTWGRIMEELENEYVLSLPGASVATVEKKYIEPFSDK